MSTPPYRSAVALHISSTLSGSVTSTLWKNASRASAAVCCPWSSATSATQTLAPSSEKRSVASRPIPPPAPVMTATFPSSRPMRTRSLAGEVGQDPVESCPTRVGVSRGGAADPGEDDIPRVALVGDPGVAVRVELPVNAVGVALQSLLRRLIAEERVDRLQMPFLGYVNREDP